MKSKFIIPLFSTLLFLNACGPSNNTTASDILGEKEGYDNESASTESEEESHPVMTLNAEQEGIVASTNQLAIEFFKKAADKENMVFSPLSISVAMAMTYTGANGTTETEMAKVLHFEKNTAAFHQKFAELTAAIAKPYGQGNEITIANKIFLQNGMSAGIKPEFKKVTTDIYKSAYEELNMADKEAACNTINAWVAEQTKNKIPKLFSPRSFPNDAKMVLANAIYFLGEWGVKFKEEATQTADFYTVAAKAVPTKFMNLEIKTQDAIKYGRKDDLQLLRMDYKGGKTSMLIALPTEKTSLDAIVRSLDFETFALWLNTCSGQYEGLNISIPKWKLETTIEADKTFKAMGMQIPFAQGKANFSGIDGTSDLYISKIVHKAMIDVSEKGTEAAAATGVVMSGRGVAKKVEPIEFKANRPFLYFIVDNDSGSILFMGQYTAPTQTES